MVPNLIMIILVKEIAINVYMKKNCKDKGISYEYLPNGSQLLTLPHYVMRCVYHANLI